MKPDEREYLEAVALLDPQSCQDNYEFAKTRCSCAHCGGSGVMHHKRAEFLQRKWMERGYIELINSYYGAKFTTEGLAWLDTLGIPHGRAHA